jgi:LmbE family N-acetylglucosaminyl deacetylase
MALVLALVGGAAATGPLLPAGVTPAAVTPAAIAPPAVAPALPGVPPSVARPPGLPPVAGLALPAAPRVAVFAPHPDDETVAVGGFLARLVRQRVPVRVVFVTNGDGYSHAVEEELDRRQAPTGADYLAFGQRRQREAVAAARRLGLRRRDLSFLGFPDGGLAELWRTHWSRPYTSPFTREDRPPYPGAVSPEADYDGEDLTSVISRVLRDFRPTVVLMPHPHDDHLDHAHTSYFVTEAVSGLQATGVLPIDLRVLTYVVHYPSWPATRGPGFDRFLPIGTIPDTAWSETELGADELAAKRAALAEYRSQLDVMGGFLRRFLCRNELFATVDGQLLARIASVH